MSESERYGLQEEIGRGGGGVVYRGRDRNLDRDVAIKRLGDAHAARPDLVARFQAEARIAGQLQHPGVVPVYELGSDDEQHPFIAMKLVEGRTLQELLADPDSSVESRGRHLRLFTQVCETVAFAHSRGIVHRDLKPANVMIGEFGEVQVVDWGLARPVGESGEEPGSVFGTPSYMSPEQARGEVDRVDRRSDVFALGATLCEILTGAPPYQGTTAEVLEASRSAHLEPALDRLRDADVEPELKDLVRACLEEEPEDRPVDASQVAAAVEAHLDGLEERNRQAGLVAAEARGRAVHERRLRQRTMALAAAVVVAVVGIGGVLTWRQWEQGRQADDLATEVGQVLGEIRSLQMRAEVDAAPLPLREKAAATAEHAWSLVTTGPARDSLREEVRRVREEVVGQQEAARLEADRVAKDVALLELCNGLISRWNVDSWAQSDAAFHEAFLDYGLDVDRMTREEALDVFADRPLAMEIAQALFAWIRVRAILEQGPDMAQSEWFVKVFWIIQQADPDPQMREIRRVTLNGDVAPLVALADRPSSRTMDARPALYLGVLLHDLGAPMRAVAFFQEHLPRFPRNDGMHLMLGEFLMELDGAEEAVPVLHAALAMEPELVRVWTLLAEAHATLGHWPYAVSYARGALALAPDHVPTRLVLVRGLHRVGQADESQAEWERLWAEEKEDPAIRLHQAEQLAWAGDSEEAADLLVALVRSPGVDPRVLTRSAGMLADVGRPDVAVLVFAALRQRGLVSHREGQLHLQLGRTEDAIGALRAALRVGDDPLVRAWLEEAKEWLLIEDDLPAEVSGIDRPADLARAARIWESRGEYARASRFWEAALDQDPEAGQLPGASARRHAVCCALQAGPGHQGNAESWVAEELERRASRPWVRTDHRRPEALKSWLWDPQIGPLLDEETHERLRQAALAASD